MASGMTDSSASLPLVAPVELFLAASGLPNMDFLSLTGTAFEANGLSQLPSLH